MNDQNAFQRTQNFIRNSPTLKMVSMGILLLVLLIPKSMVTSLMSERQGRRQTVIREINQKWGKDQLITGPFFTIPYKAYFTDENDILRYRIEHLHILPENLNISGIVEPETRYRGIYEAVLYNTQLTLAGSFIPPVLTQTGINPENILWDQAVLSLGITDMRGIQDTIEMKFADAVYPVNPGLETNDLAGSGVRAAIPFPTGPDSHAFSVQLDLNGSEQLQFIPVGKETTVALESRWPSPSFNGAFLPVERDVSDTGFNARWKILHLNRNFPQIWENGSYTVRASEFGLELIITADIYQKSMRILKYAIMFIVFTFSALFFSEIISRHRLHPIQYLLIGLAIILFYVLLISMSEHFSFDTAYILSALAITVMITGYSRGITGHNRFTALVGALLVILYGYLYIVLQLEDYALLMGSIGLFIVLGTVMYITRKIDWYTLGKDGTP